MARTISDETQKTSALANLMGKQANTNRYMYMPLSLERLREMGSALPEAAFSDRLTGIAYEPRIGQMDFRPTTATGWGSASVAPARFKVAGPFMNSIMGTPEELFGVKRTKVRSQYNPDDFVLGQYDPQNKMVSVNPDLVGNEARDTLHHEIQHHVTRDARPETTQYGAWDFPDEKRRPMYIEYRADPHEYIARRAADAMDEPTVMGVAKRFNDYGTGIGTRIGELAETDGIDVREATPPKGHVGRPLNKMSYGYHPQYSQIDPTEGFRNFVYGLGPHDGLDNPADAAYWDKLLREIDEVESQPKWKKWMGKAGDALSRASKGSKRLMAGLGPLAEVLNVGYAAEGASKAKKAGANPLYGALQAGSFAPITEDLGDRVYDHQTGETKWKKWYEGGML